MNILQYISNNPFRILGVFTTATAKEIAANTSRINAYAKVGKEISFDVDAICSNFLIAPARTTSSINVAHAAINLPENKIKYSLFWFVKAKPIDDIILNNLVSGNIDKSIELCNKQITPYSLINKALIGIINKDYVIAIDSYIQLISDDLLCSEYVKTIVGENYEISSVKLLNIIIETLISFNDTDIIGALLQRNETKDLTTEYLISAPKKTIQDGIAMAKSINNKDAIKNLEAGKKLMKDTKSALQELQSVLGTSNLTYQRLADNLANQILQCSINYYNETEELSAPHKAEELATYALSIAVGEVTKARVKENYSIIHKNALNCPPEEVVVEVQNIHVLYKSSGNTKDIIKKIIPYLIEILDILGENHSYLPIIATEVSNKMLNDLIDSVNILNQWSNNKITVINDAWETIAYLERIKTLFNFTPEFAARFNTNKATLKSIRTNLGYSYEPKIDHSLFRTDDEIYNACRSNEDFEEYVKIKPRGKHVSEVNERLKMTQKHTESAQKLLDEDKTIETCIKVHQKYPYADELTSAIFWELCKRSRKKRQLYLEIFGENGPHAANIRRRERRITKGYISLLVITILLFCVSIGDILVTTFASMGTIFGLLFMWMFENDKDDTTPPSEIKKMRAIEKKVNKQIRATKLAAYKWSPRIWCLVGLFAINLTIGLVSFLSYEDTIGLTIVFCIGVIAGLIDAYFILTKDENDVEKAKRYSYWIDGILAFLFIIHLIWGTEGLGVVAGICAFLGFYALIGLIRSNL